MRHEFTILLCLATIGIAQAESTPRTATGAQLKRAVAGNTVEGTMEATGRYTEFYAGDGTVKGKDYKAAWTIEGDKMCWVYDGQPKDCWNAALKGTTVKWIKDGKVQGSGTIVKGNSNGF